MALIKGGGGGGIIFTEKGGEAKVRGDEIKREGLKSITNYERKLLFKKNKTFMGVLEIFVILPIKVTERGFQFPQDVRSEVYLLLQKKNE